MLFNKPSRDQVIALTGVYRACTLVDVVARDGQASKDQLETTVDSLFVQNPTTTEEVFGGIDNLQDSFSQMDKALLTGTANASPEILRYMMGVHYLATKLRKQTAMLEHISNRLNEIQRQRAHFSTLHESVISSLADLYVETIGTFQRRIQVNGFAQNLQQPQIAAKIRCLLFAGVRASILWQQLGGRKTQLILYRKDMQSILRSIHSEHSIP